MTAATYAGADVNLVEQCLRVRVKRLSEGVPPRSLRSSRSAVAPAIELAIKQTVGRHDRPRLRNVVRSRVALQYMLESTVVQRETDRAASLLFLPSDALGLVGLDSRPTAIPGLGVVRGVQIPSPEGIEDVFFASMSGRFVPFDEGSFDRWRPQRQSRSTSYEAAFAHQLATSEFVPVTSSPIRGTSLVKLMTQGTAWTVSVAEGLVHDPLRGLAVLVVSEIGITVAQIVGAARSTAVIAVKWRMRQRLGIPADWVPPEDRPPKP